MVFFLFNRINFAIYLVPRGSINAKGIPPLTRPRPQPITGTPDLEVKLIFINLLASNLINIFSSRI